MQKLKRAFFAQDCIKVSQKLLGKLLVFAEHVGIITETEAYVGYADDASCHAHNRRTKRTEIMYGAAGYSYVYFIYGMYHCLNIVTEQIDVPAATLIRGIKLITPPFSYINGPGKLCKQLGITTANHNNIDLIDNNNFYIADADITLSHIITPRIGISKAIDKPWRFLAKDLLPDHIAANIDIKLLQN